MKLHEQIADKVKIRIEGLEGQRLPPLQDLAEQYRVSKVTMGKAIRLLSNQGLLQSFPGKGILVTSVLNAENPRESNPYPNSVNKLFEKIKGRILEGTYRIGQVLPKTNYYSISEHLSPVTVCSALKKLEKDKLVWKRGKAWIVGPGSTSSVTQTPRLAPVILMLVPDFKVWYKDYHEDHPSKFLQNFYLEIERMGIKTELVMTGPTQSEFVSQKAEHVRTTIQELGSRYMGTLCLFEKIETQPLKEWISWLGQFQKPVVWLDIDCFGKKVDYKAIKGGKHFYRCYKDEAFAVRMMLNTLEQLGHKKIGFPYLQSEAQPWIAHRIEMFRQIMEKEHPNLSMVVTEQKESIWFPKPWEGPEAFLHYVDTLRKAGEEPRGEWSAARSLEQHIPSLLDLIRKDKVTAIIAPNDYFAHQYYLWLKAVHVSVPGDVSLLSFDNNQYSKLYPIYSVDFGFHDLSYCAAHIFIGDIPVQADRFHHIASKPYVVDRGSLAAPKKNIVMDRRPLALESAGTFSR